MKSKYILNVPYNGNTKLNKNQKGKEKINCMKEKIRFAYKFISNTHCWKTLCIACNFNKKKEK